MNRTILFDCLLQAALVTVAILAIVRGYDPIIVVSVACFFSYLLGTMLYVKD